jgi:hypothetical protein
MGLVDDTDHEVSMQVNAPDSSGAEDNARIRATFVYAGIDVEHQGLSPEPGAARSPDGSPSSPTVAFGFTDEWQQLILTLEEALRLHRHTPGTLSGVARYPHQRTGGMIGSLSHLVRGAAIDAILDSTEQIIKPLLDSIDLDHAAQNNAGRKPSKLK